MDYVTVRELREKSGKIWQRVEAGEEFVVTRNGEPFALLVHTEPAAVEKRLRALRMSRFGDVVRRIRAASAQSGAAELADAEIQAEIEEARRKHARRPPVRLIGARRGPHAEMTAEAERQRPMDRRREGKAPEAAEAIGLYQAAPAAHALEVNRPARLMRNLDRWQTLELHRFGHPALAAFATDPVLDLELLLNRFGFNEAEARSLGTPRCRAPGSSDATRCFNEAEARSLGTRRRDRRRGGERRASMRPRHEASEHQHLSRATGRIMAASMRPRHEASEHQRKAQAIAAGRMLQ